MNYYDAENCIGVCKCSSGEYQTQRANCGEGGIAYFSEVTCTAVCKGCSEVFKKADQDCKESGGTLMNFNCTEDQTTGAILIKPSWDCEGAPQFLYPPETDPAIPPETIPQAPNELEPEPVPNAPSPSDPAANPWDESIKKELENQTNQLNNSLKDQANQTSLLKWIGNSLGIVNNNIAKLLNQKKQNQSSDSKELTKLRGEVNDLVDEVSDMSEGNYHAPPGTPDYTVPEHDFGIRTTQFFNEMKSTGLFSIPNQLKDSIPGGGSSILTIQSGTTFGGEHTIDFNWLSAGLTTLKYLFQIAGMALAIRIVTLKR
ncbi:hypothetical protein [Desulfopila aestuarii]|uniref:hypothetical protein n=1 Tax=Desulfopila aestuarii TaxID=231440 RepID=UPI000935B3BF|nr:hypothetical protein [Desulfopila aestuarii]